MARAVSYFEALTLPSDTNARFDEAIGLTSDGLHELYEQRLVRGAQVFGSAILGAAGPRSDLDVLIMTREETSETQLAIKALAHRVYRQTAVPLEASCFTQERLNNREHPYQSNTTKWLRQQAASHPHSVIGWPPADSIRCHDEGSLRSNLVSWLRSTAYALEKYELQGHSPRSDDMLAYVLNMPHVAGRKTIDVLEYVGQLPPGTLRSVRREDIADAVYHVFGYRDEALWSLYRDMSHDYELYDELVLSVLGGGIEYDEFGQMVEETLSVNVPKAVRLLRAFHRLSREPSYDEQYLFRQRPGLDDWDWRPRTGASSEG